MKIRLEILLSCLLLAACSTAPDPLVLEGVTPGRIPAQETATIEIAGNHFYAVARVDLDDKSTLVLDKSFGLAIGGVDIASRDIRLVDSETLSANLPPLPDGTYDVHVTTPSGELVTLDDGLLVGDPAARWWDPRYGYRQRLTITETADDLLPAGYSVVVNGLDTGSLVGAGQMQTDGRDLRIVAWDATSFVELDRRLIAMNSAATSVWFATRVDIADTDTNYFLYYGNSSANTAPDHWSDSMGADEASRVYLAADDFQGHGSGACPDGWGDCAGEWEIVENGQERVLSSGGNALYLFAGDTSWTDVAVEARVRSLDPDGCPGIVTRVEDELNLVFAGYNCGTSVPLPPENIAVWPRQAGQYTPLFYEVVSIGSEFHNIAVAWTSDVVRLYHDGLYVGQEMASNVGSSGRVGFFSTYATTLFADHIVVRRFVDPEPTVLPGAPEEYSP